MLRQQIPLKRSSSPAKPPFVQFASSNEEEQLFLPLFNDTDKTEQNKLRGP
jgi:hypothetical protein